MAFIYFFYVFTKMIVRANLRPSEVSIKGTVKAILKTSQGIPVGVEILYITVSCKIALHINFSVKITVLNKLLIRWIHTIAT